MKHYSLGILALAALVSVSCLKETASDPAPSRKVTIRDK